MSRTPRHPAAGGRAFVGCAAFGVIVTMAAGAPAQPAPRDAPPPGAEQSHGSAPAGSAQAGSSAELEALVVRVDAGDTGIDPEAVRAAIGRELQVPVTGAAAQPAAAGVLDVRIDAAQVVMKYEAANGTEIYRKISRPQDIERAIDTVALLAGNLVRDQASEILEALRRKYAAKLAATQTKGAAPATPPPAKPESRKARKPAGKGDEPAAEPADEEPLPPLSVAPANLSLFFPVSTFPDSDERFVALEIGLLYSRLGALYGVGVSSGVMDVEQDEHGVGVAALWSSNGGDLNGVKVAGGAVLLDGVQRGMSVAGGVHVARGDLYGLRVSGGADVSRGDHTGIVVSGGVNVLDGSFKGVQVAGGVNVLSGGTNPAQAGYGLVAAGGANVWTGTWRGVQLGGVNVGLPSYPEEGRRAAGSGKPADEPAPEPARVQGLQVHVVGGDGGNLTGAQMSAGVNVAATVRGAQIAPINVARRITGVQLGLVNVAEEVDGVALGLVSVSKNGGLHAVAWGSNQTAFNVGVKSRAGPIYTLWAAGIHPGSDEADYVVEPSFAIGGHLPIRSFFVEPEVGYAWRVPMKGNESVSQHHVTRLRGKVGWQIWEPFAIFAGGGAQYDATDRELGPEVLGGVQLF